MGKFRQSEEEDPHSSGSHMPVEDRPENLLGGLYSLKETGVAV